ncbi:dihydrofolate reductase family protein [Ruminococcus sp. CLA-AA-H200]|uniref:Dihydrofolate reductase family protein n=1 Tax=Ruminococcus turbiniformis TaxID=2881258 RepID=A0ABS8FU53_9FIRM|nr:dihydrofolate reductase family protein [Ruminococcus turbiniformis]MCC2253516.1 dihydrofolate reductase family protein [Ruminococcus turbiniformis]
MRSAKLYIAMSVDGYIEDSKGDVGWLEGHGKDEENIDTYSEFTENIDTILMGWKTYNQVVTELSPDKWIYDDFTTYVISHHRHESSEKIHFTNINPAGLIRKLKEEEGKDIWICGGASIVQQLMDEDLIDCYYITIIPTLLGSGIRLFKGGNREIKLRLLNTRSYNGMTELIYVRR